MAFNFMDEKESWIPMCAQKVNKLSVGHLIVAVRMLFLENPRDYIANILRISYKMNTVPEGQRIASETAMYIAKISPRAAVCSPGTIPIPSVK